MCGILGIVARSPVNQLLYDGLLLLQHRGQDAAGIVTAEHNSFHMHKAPGMVRDVFRTRNMRSLPGNIGIAHCRYPTAGSAFNAAEAQPFYVNSPFGIVSRYAVSFSCVVMPGALAVVLPWSPRASSQRQQVTPPEPGFTVTAASPCQASPSLRVVPATLADPCTMKIKRGNGGSRNSTFSALDSTSSYSRIVGCIHRS